MGGYWTDPENENRYEGAVAPETGVCCSPGSLRVPPHSILSLRGASRRGSRRTVGQRARLALLRHCYRDCRIAAGSSASAAGDQPAFSRWGFALGLTCLPDGSCPVRASTSPRQHQDRCPSGAHGRHILLYIPPVHAPNRA
jgi:hypothetical protein